MANPYRLLHDPDRTARSSAAALRRHLIPVITVIGTAMALLAAEPASAQSRVSQANYDFDASGFVVPAGMPPLASPSQVMPVGYNAGGCASGACDSMPMMMGMGGGYQPAQSMQVCGTCGSGSGCGCHSLLGGGGLLEKWRQHGGTPCLFCRGAGCTACRELPFGYCGSVLAGCLDCLKPYEGASLCNQRWYDLSVEALIMDRELGGSVPGVVTTRGIDGDPVLSLGDIDSSDLQGGVRVSAAMIFGVGSNLELTYMGGNEWSGGAAAVSDSPNLYSFISDYGTNPSGGFDDTDRSLRQSLDAESSFHSAELNYRRRTMFPYCRFQSSWLVGLRYLRYDDSLLYQTTGLDNDTVNGNLPRFFSSLSDTENNLFGPQAGFDFWWNVYPGISMGLGWKGAWVQNDVDRRVTLRANSIPTGQFIDETPVFVARSEFAEEGDRKGTFISDFELKMVYRFAHSWTFRTSYFAIAVDDIAYGGLDPNTQPLTLTGAVAPPRIAYDDLVLQGFTVGLEYLW
ncbi:BBP7 family outer membrane beta-barrel protein [Roseiconus nitratireducens]|nr:BBP7 family outer membrane beta-barrel protein [Roseiconus nitratireducens]